MATIRLLFFGSLGDLFGRERGVEWPGEGSTVGDIRALLAGEHDAISAPSVRASVDRQLAAENMMVLPGQEVAFFSPVSGG